MLSRAKRGIKTALNYWPAYQRKDEYDNQRFTHLNERPVEFAYVFRHITSLQPQSVLDVGSGTTALPALIRDCGPTVTAIDNVRDYWASGMTNPHYHVIDDDITASKLSGSFDLATCISVLEHIKDFDAAMSNIFRLLKDGGHLILTVPYSESEYVPNCYDLPGASYGQDVPYITQSFSRREVEQWLSRNQATLVDQEFWRVFEGERWTQGKRLPPTRATAQSPHQLSCMLFRK